MALSHEKGLVKTKKFTCYIEELTVQKYAKQPMLICRFQIGGHIYVLNGTIHIPQCVLYHNKQEVKGSIDKLQGPVVGALARREEMVSGARPLEGQKIQETSTLLNTNWDKLNKLYQDRLK